MDRERRTAGLLRAMSNPLRRRIVARLAAAPAATGELARCLGAARVTVSHHLAVLVASGLVDQRQRRAALRPEALKDLRDYFDRALTLAARQGSPASGRRLGKH